MINKPVVLLTGFKPFGGETENPSWLAVQPLDGEIIGGHRVVSLELDCVFDTAIEQLYRALDEYKPELVLCFGQAGGRADISIERIAINLNDARIPDNAGNLPLDTQVIDGGPDGYLTRLPAKRMLRRLHNAGIPASLSYSAGTFVCNHVMYALLHYIATHDLAMCGGFIHVPYLPRQAVHHSGAPSMPLSTLTDAVKHLIIEGLIQGDDIKFSAGTTH